MGEMGGGCQRQWDTSLVSGFVNFTLNKINISTIEEVAENFNSEQLQHVDLGTTYNSWLLPSSNYSIISGRQD